METHLLDLQIRGTWGEVSMIQKASVAPPGLVEQTRSKDSGLKPAAIVGRGLSVRFVSRGGLAV
jgi:hypothetical protein